MADVPAAELPPVDGQPDAGEVLPNPPMVISFTATPLLLPAAGGMVQLSWVVRDATMLSVTGVGPVTGDGVTVMVASSQTFALTAWNAGGSDTKVARVEVDSSIPMVTSSSPADSATGVAGDTNIVVTFSEPMNRGKTQAAYSSPDIPAALAAFSWNDMGTVLTINPANDLAYAEGTTVDAPARTYSVTFSSIAEDLAGNKLGQTVLTFKTLRRLSLKMRRLSALDGWADSGGTALATDGTNIWVGDTATNTPMRGFLSYDIGPLPAGLISIDKAEAFAYQMTVVGMPYATLGGSLLADHVTFDAFSGLAFNLAPLRAVGVMSADADPGWKKADVLSAVRDDFTHRAARGGRSQYRLSFAASSNDNVQVDRVELYDSADAFEPYLNVTITTP